MDGETKQILKSGIKWFIIVQAMGSIAEVAQVIIALLR